LSRWAVQRRPGALSDYGHVVAAVAMIIPASAPGADGVVVRGAQLVIGDWSASGTATEVAPLHVHHQDDEAWHVISGALRFRFEDREVHVGAGSSVLVPAGVAHTFGNAGPSPSRFIIILPERLDELIRRLHDTDRREHTAIYERHASQLLE
jgi:mannose-6-phosphate isomerase-like protein (cupin superfamily)